MTISDEQQHQKNPVGKFQKIINELAYKNDLQGAFSWRIDDIEIDTRSELEENRDWGFSGFINMPNVRNPKIVRLALPPEDDLENWIVPRLKPFFERCVNLPTQKHSIRIQENYSADIEVVFSLEYDPSSSYSGGSHAVYTSENDIERHGLWRRIKEKSEKQFGNASEKVPRILFVCDGDCSVLSKVSKNTSENHVDDIIRYFWRKQIYNEEDRKWTWTE